MTYHTTLLTIDSSVFLAIAKYFADFEGTCLLYSGGHLDSAQRSWLGLFPFESITAYGQQLYCQKGKHVECMQFNNPWDGLQEHFFHPLAADAKAMAFGWFGYGMGAFADQDKTLPYRPSSVPDAFWQRCAVVLEMDKTTGLASAQVNLSVLEQVEERAKPWVKCFATDKGWQELFDLLPKEVMRYERNPSRKSFSDCSNRYSTYIHKVEQVQELIRAGEIYQVNLSQLFEFHSSRHPFSFFRQMCELNPAPFSAYFRHKETSIVSTSPERFLCKKGRTLETRPIKGTIQRGKSEEEDQYLKQTLLASPKERAELLMITDLMRNDLGKISTVGSVQTLDVWRCEAYTNVFHLISIIRSTVRPDLKPLDLIRACFPGGSITGCPKLRAMEVIDDLERRPRGIYTGSIGYITGQGDFDLNIAIRTLVKERETFSLQLGGGIVIDSNPDQEYQETLFKGESLFQTLQSEEIICV
jgi:para-aminobenzoate synthetase component 1